MKNILKMNRNELIQELRKNVHPLRYQQVIRESTAEMRGLLVHFKSTLEERTDAVPATYERFGVPLKRGYKKGESIWIVL